MWRLINSCQNKVSANQYRVMLLQAQINKSWRLTRYWFFDWIAGSSRVTTLGEKERVGAEAKFRSKLILGGLLTYLPTYSLHNRLLESPRFIAYVICTILSIICLHFTGKNGETHAEKITCSQLIIFWVSDPRKTNLRFLLRLINPHPEDRRAAFSVDP